MFCPHGDSLRQARVASASLGRKAAHERLPALDKLSDFLRLGCAFGGILTAVHPMPEKRQVRHIDPAERVNRSASDEWKDHATHETQAQSQNPERRVLWTSQELAMIIWRLIVHEL